MKYGNIREEELKNKIAKDYFWLYDCTRIIGNVDFCVSMHKGTKDDTEPPSLLWAEAKKGSSDIYKSIVQLILTIGRARTFDKYLPPSYLGAFDAEKIAFIPYNDIHDIFYMNDFNWKVTPSDYTTKEFQMIYDKVKKIIDENALLFEYEKDDKELKTFIKNNFKLGNFGQSKIKIDKNNFVIVYNKWLQTVKPTIAVNWDAAKKTGIIDGDFYLADLLSEDNVTLKDKLFVLLNHDHYELDRKTDESGLFSSKKAEFTDGQKAHNQFWNKYERPPLEEYWDYIVERRDLLVPQDIRERKGSFFTPQIWVELSQKYIADVLGENWQDEYYVWDCAAGTGNLLNGLTNKYNIWASTIDEQDVEVMKDRIRNGANLLESHVFQFDFLNDDFSKLPTGLQEIINDSEKRKKLVIYINPPYAEAASAKTVTGTGKNKSKTATDNKIYLKYKNEIGNASNEIFAQFLIRIYKEIPDCIIAHFSTLKAIQSNNFRVFRNVFQAKLCKLFVVPAYTFDNVKGKFPIGFHIWDTSIKENVNQILADVYDENGVFFQQKKIIILNNIRYINDWYSKFYDKNPYYIGIMNTRGNDFQNQNYIRITSDNNFNHTNIITPNNLIISSIYFSVRHCIEATWLNDRDQFLWPKDGWQTDTEFQNDCLAFTLFHTQNRITSKEGTNHWIPFTEDEVNARDKFDSHFMTDFISGKLKSNDVNNIFDNSEMRNTPLVFSDEAKAVFDAGRELWRYYHAQPDSNPNASYYDIREYFQGRYDNGKMKNKSDDEKYMELLGNLKDAMSVLAKKIEQKVYEYGFLIK
jgi:hypothetical protein